MADLLNQAREAYIHGGETDVDIDLDLAPNLPRMMADRRRVLQVLGNLIATASSHQSRSSHVRISASPNDLYVAVGVTRQPSDTTRQGWLHHLESAEGQSDGVSGKRGGRDELRIAICEGIVEAHGGRLLIEDRDTAPDSGFSFTVPIADEVTSVNEQAAIQSPSALDIHEGQARVLAACQNTETGRYVRNILSEARFNPVVTGDPFDAERLVEEHAPHVIVLEPALPWDDGFEMLIHVGRISAAPIILVAGPGWDMQIGRAFELGAFDYIAKPFTSSELIARIHVALRRVWSAGWNDAPRRFVQGDLAIDYVGRNVSVAGRPVHLTTTEYKLLAELSTVAGRVLTHEQLLTRVWGPRYSGDLRIVRQYIKELRHKLGDDASNPSYIFTELGVGYRMARSPT